MITRELATQYKLAHSLKEVGPQLSLGGTSDTQTGVWRWLPPTTCMIPAIAIYLRRKGASESSVGREDLVGSC